MAGNRARGGTRKQHLAETESADTFEDLLVFGYACKLFRDDDKALSIEQGNLLIPWMGDDSIKIDRYDARGTLFDLKSHETPPGGYDRSGGRTAEEIRIERLCDDERYFALYKDESEEAVIKEEEIKRLNQDLADVTSQEVSYRQVPFSYGDQTDNSNTLHAGSNEGPVKSTLGELGDAIFIPPPMLDVPPDMVVPPTQKLARIIEKTALFISSQGPQMEIVVKAKQASNPMFQFLHFDCSLHPYYRHILAAIRNGCYVVPADEEADCNEKNDQSNNGTHSQQSDSEDDNYLHPSLQPRALEPIASPPVTEKAEDAPASEPTAEVCQLMDKAASYMARMGRHLEIVVLGKGDVRFAFLNKDHPFHSYYADKVSVYLGMIRKKETSSQAAIAQPGVKEANAPVPVADPELLKSERRRRAALFLDQMKRERIAAADGSDAETAETGSTASTVQKSKSRSPDDGEVIDRVSRHSRDKSRSVSLSPSPKRRRSRRSPSLRKTRSRSPSRHRSTSRTRRKGRSRSLSRHRRRSPDSPEKRRHHRQKKHRSRDRRKKDKKRRRSRDRMQKRSRRHRRSRSASRSSRSSRNSSDSFRSRSSSQSPVELRRSPIAPVVRKASEVVKSSSETSSPLPPQLLTAQPAFNKIAEGLRAKVLAMIDGDGQKK